MIKTAVLRARKGVPGVGQRIAGLFGGLKCQVTCNNLPLNRIADGGLVINYGRADWPAWNRPDLRWLNMPSSVSVSSNKIKSLRVLEAEGVPTLRWTTNRDVACDWMPLGDEQTVFARKTVNGKKGEGIVMADCWEDLPDAPLYTLKYDKKHEFRVFVAGGQVIDLVQKKKMSADTFKVKGRVEEIDMDLRNYRRGWVFAHEDLNLGRKGQTGIEELSLCAMNAIDLDYGAVDVLYKAWDDMVVCEINSAPAMRGKQTWSAFKEYFLHESRC